MSAFALTELADLVQVFEMTIISFMAFDSYEQLIQMQPSALLLEEPHKISFFLAGPVEVWLICALLCILQVTPHKQ
jgi:hypothetical protein